MLLLFLPKSAKVMSVGCYIHNKARSTQVTNQVKVL